ncbi:MAG TPA: hypothetical protein DE060_04165 [Lentisphaeria bacterium]|nr:hypothetical protein [Lentisphaeria bacterium]
MFAQASFVSRFGASAMIRLMERPNGQNNTISGYARKTAFPISCPRFRIIFFASSSDFPG